MAIDVKLHNRTMAVHRGVPIDALQPVHPAGAGQKVVIIQGDFELIGDVCHVTRMDNDTSVHLTDVDIPDCTHLTSAKSLAVLSRM